MKILTIDTTTKNLYAIVIDGEKIFQSNIFNCQNKHSESLCNAIKNVLTLSNLTFSDIDAYAVATGPGSFTGIRIGVSTIKGINVAVPKKLISLNNLYMLAKSQNKTSAVIDAGNGWYFQNFEAGDSSAENAIAIAEKGISKTENTTAPKLISYDDSRALVSAKFDADMDYTEILAKVSTELFLKNQFSSTLTPLYIRRSQAEENAK